jgi:hypothetical protein
MIIMVKPERLRHFKALPELDSDNETDLADRTAFDAQLDESIREHLSFTSIGGLTRQRLSTGAATSFTADEIQTILSNSKYVSYLSRLQRRHSLANLGRLACQKSEIGLAHRQLLDAIERETDSDLVIGVTLGRPGWPVLTIDAPTPEILVGCLVPATARAAQFSDLVTPSTTGTMSAETLHHWPLRPEWSRVVVVEAVRQRMPYPIEEHALTVDRALAWIGVGDDDTGSELLSYASDWLYETAGRVVAGELSAAVSSELLRAVEAAARLLSRDKAARFADLLITAQERSIPASVGGVNAALQRLVRVPTTLGDQALPAWTLLTGAVDPVLVPPRVVVWHGAKEPELSGIHTSDADAVTVTANLAAGIHATDHEARELVAWSAPRDGEFVWSSVRLNPVAHQHAITGELRLHSRSPSELVFGIASSDRLEDIRADPIGLLRTQVDRLLVDAWAVNRLAGAGAVLTPGRSRVQLRWSRLHAAHLVETADQIQRSIIAALAESNQIRSVEVAARRLDRIVDYRQDLRESANWQRPANRPLLSELLLVADGPREPM